MKRITHIAVAFALSIPAAAVFAQGAGGGQGAVQSGPQANGSTSSDLGNPTGQAVQPAPTPYYHGNSPYVQSDPVDRGYISSVGVGPVRQTERATGEGDSPMTPSGTSPTGGASGGGN